MMSGTCAMVQKSLMELSCHLFRPCCKPLTIQRMHIAVKETLQEAQATPTRYP